MLWYQDFVYRIQFVYVCMKLGIIKHDFIYYIGIVVNSLTWPGSGPSRLYGQWQVWGVDNERPKQRKCEMAGNHKLLFIHSL